MATAADATGSSRVEDEEDDEEDDEAEETVASGGDILCVVDAATEAAAVVVGATVAAVGGGGDADVEGGGGCAAADEDDEEFVDVCTAAGMRTPHIVHWAEPPTELSLLSSLVAIRSRHRLLLLFTRDMVMSRVALALSLAGGNNDGNSETGSRNWPR